MQDDTVESKMQSLALREIATTDDVTIQILTSDVDRDLSIITSSFIASTPSSLVVATHACARQDFRDPLNDITSPLNLKIGGGGREDRTDPLIKESVDELNHSDHVTAIGICELVDETRTINNDIGARGHSGQHALAQRLSTSSGTAPTPSLRLVNDGVGIDV